MTSPWTDEKVEQLRKHWDDGLSQSQCAALLGDGFTRNAVSGKVRQLGIAGDRRAYRAAKKCAKVAPKAKAVTKIAVKGKEPKKIGVQFIERSAPVASIPLPVTGRVNMMDLRSHHCRFPIGDPTSEDFLFCGGDRVPGKPYCAGHAQLCYYEATNANRIRLPRGV